MSFRYYFVLGSYAASWEIWTHPDLHEICGSLRVLHPSHFMLSGSFGKYSYVFTASRFFCTFIFRRRLIVGNPICVRGWAHMGWSIQYNSHPDSGCKMATDLQKVDSFKKKKKNKRYRLGDYGGHPHEPRHTHTLVHSQGIQHNVIKYFIRILKPQKVCPFSSSFPFCQFLYFLSLWQVNSSSQ